MRRRWKLGLTLAFVVVLLGVVGAVAKFDRSSGSLAQAVRSLGPISGWRCARTPVYVYDPRRESADATLLAEAPERFLLDHAADLRIERVEVSLRGGDTVVWTRLGTAVDGPRRVYVLSPGRLQSIGVESDGGWTEICTSHLGDWQIVAEHALE